MKMKRLMAIAGIVAVMAGTMPFMEANEVNAAEEDKKVLKSEQLVDEGYTVRRGTARAMIISTENLYRNLVLTPDGVIHELHDSNGKYGYLHMDLSSPFNDVLYSINSDNQYSIFNFDGTFYGGLNGFYTTAQIARDSNNNQNDGSYFYTDQNKVTYYCAKDGNEKARFQLDKPIFEVFQVGDYFYVESDEKLSGNLYNADGSEVSGFSPEDGLISTVHNNRFSWLQMVSVDYDGPGDVIERNDGSCKYVIKYYTSDLQEITKEEFDAYEDEKNSWTTAKKYEDVDSNEYSLSEGFTAIGTYQFDGIMLVMGEKPIEGAPNGEQDYTLFNTDGTIFLDNIYYPYCFNDKFVTLNGKNLGFAQIKAVTETGTDVKEDNTNTTGAVQSPLTNDASTSMFMLLICAGISSGLFIVSLRKKRVHG